MQYIYVFRLIYNLLLTMFYQFKMYCSGENEFFHFFNSFNQIIKF